MMKTLPVDIASVCTPTESHYSILKELIEYPIKGIFCEKPLAAGVNEAKEAVSMCNKNKVVFAVNHTRRWDSNYLLSKQMVHSGKIGQVTAVSAYYPTAVFSAGTHLFDTVRMIIEKNPEIVSGISLDSNNRDPGVSGWIQYKENIICGVTSTGKREDLIFELDIIGEEGRLRILENGEKIELSSFDSSARYTGYRELTPVSIKTIPQKDRFIEAVKDIVAVIEGKKDAVNCSGEDGFLSLATSVAMVESAQRKGVPRTVENMA